MGKEVIEVKLEELKELIKTSDKPLIVDFYTPTCAPCKVLAPMLDEIAARSGDTVTIVKVDASRDWSAASSFFVTTAPTLIKFRNGKELDRIQGIQSRDFLLTWIEK